MTTHPDTTSFEGEAGIIDCALDWPDGDPRGWALLLHPHPLHGGARGNKVVTTLSRACTEAGLLAVRPDFRGVGKSAGSYDDSHGETRDMLALVAQFAERHPDVAGGNFVLGGFSFGSAVASKVHAQLPSATTPANALLLIGTAVARFDVEPVPAETLVVHGEHDETVPLADVLDWARPQDLPVVVVPGATHFFHGKLIVLRRLVSTHLRSRLANP